MTPRESVHQDVWDVLPWYVNGTLEERELDAITAHVSACDACRDEIARCRELAAGVRAAPDPGWTPSPERLTRLMGRIESFERDRIAGGWRGWLSARAAALRDMLSVTPVSMRWTLAAQTALVVLLVAAVAWQAALSTDQRYRTLASTGDQPRSGVAPIRVVFADDIMEREIRALLDTIGGSIVAGPSSTGAYTIAVPAHAAASVASALAALRADPKVRLAEPVVSQ